MIPFTNCLVDNLCSLLISTVSMQQTVTTVATSFSCNTKWGLEIAILKFWNSRWSCRRAHPTLKFSQISYCDSSPRWRALSGLGEEKDSYFHYTSRLLWGFLNSCLWRFAIDSAYNKLFPKTHHIVTKAEPTQIAKEVGKRLLTLSLI